APAARIDAIREIAAAGVPVGVMVAPIIPGLNDHEAPAIMEAARKAGATEANYTILRLPFGVKDLFIRWVEEGFPARATKILGRVRDLRGGKLNESEFGKRMHGTGPIADAIDQVFRNHKRRLGFPGIEPLSPAAFRRRGDMPLFGDQE